MLHLVYRFRPTTQARSDLAAFWQWISDRQEWFYAGLDMVVDLRWYTVTVGEDVHCVEHHVTFRDEKAWGLYRAELRRRSQCPEWEDRRTSQEDWYEILDARLLTDPPIPPPPPVHLSLEHRAETLLTRAQFVTLATHGTNGVWASTVNYVLLKDPVRLLWYSDHAAQHSRNIAEDGSVSGSLFRTGLVGAEAPEGLPVDGAQLAGTCRVIGTEEIASYHQLYYDLNFPDPDTRARWMLPQAEFHGTGPQRFYELAVERLWLYDAERWMTDQHDTRCSVRVNSLFQIESRGHLAQAGHA